ncbi:MAG: hypothetical protein KJZ84_22130 [Bryobacteraceae bacterium]|nr:hypothetical protein [Bryobacteraceae bacterium]
MAGRDELEFYAALGIVGHGPISGFARSTAQPHTLYGQPNHGPGLLGLRRSYGGNPVTGEETPADNAPDSGSNSFALDSVGEPLPNNPLPGVAFLQIRRTDEKGIQPIRPPERKVQAQVTGGLGCWAWTAQGTRIWVPACTNPVWIAVNTLLRAKGLSSASAAAQQNQRGSDGAGSNVTRGQRFSIAVTQPPSPACHARCSLCPTSLYVDVKTALTDRTEASLASSMRLTTPASKWP